eukprot:CAMPEP_0119119064 /NCGR_PEP_ID=MMETSP1310-20130426/719_1 /TAXON_ID=464262 /ORGANISM="Genus nov. species nov., Strain RCC2339" /LENGTH=402 /DNA_ID=CAMNT_0007108477 /DNA_START=166 /DNA_END=1374 /DNA_ORIENTATION=+
MRCLGFTKPVTPKEVFEEVDRQSGEAQWRDEEDRKALEEPVTLLCNMSKSPRMHPFGRIFLKQVLVKRLVERRTTWHAHKMHPELADIKIEKPIFILGFPRAGSTFLFNLLCKDPKVRFYTLWEQMDSSFAEKPNDHERTEKLRKQALDIQARMKLLYSQIHAELQHKHKLDVESPEECQFVMQKNLFITQVSDHEEYRKWMTNHDATVDYQFHKAAVQLLQHNRPKEDMTHWCFKAPIHAHHLTELLKAYPDARIILTLRHPMKSACSMASLRTTMQQIFWDPVDVSGINKNVPLRFMPLGFENAIKHIEQSADPDRFFRCHFSDLVQDPIAQCQRIYEHFGMDFHDGYKKALDDYVAPNQQAHSKTVKHKYGPEDFGMTKDDILAAYDSYIKFAGLKPEI